MLSVALPYCAMNEKKNEVFIHVSIGEAGVERYRINRTCRQV